MDAGSETEELLWQQQLAFTKQLDAESIRLQAESEPFADFEWRYQVACTAYVTATRSGQISPEEEALFDQLHAQYTERKANQPSLKQIGAEHTLDGSKHERRSSSPMFVQQDETNNDKDFGLAKALAGSKRKRDSISKDLSKSYGLVKTNESVKKSLSRLIADAPADKQQAAVQDSARLWHAIKQFPEGDVKYLGTGQWTVAGMVTPHKNHQLINSGWMREQEASRVGPKGGILADKMGLGKTLCSLTSMVHGKKAAGTRGRKTNLAVVPKALKDQWIIEARKHTLQPTSETGLGLGTVLPYSAESSSEAQMLLFKNADLIVMTYPELCSAFKNVRYPSGLSDAEKEEYFDDTIRPTLPAVFQFKFRAIYLDEGHHIRNVKTVCAMACQKLISKYRWILTGTPMTNDPTDLYSVLTFIRHPKVIKLTFKAFGEFYRGNGNNGKNNNKPVNFEWVATLLHESMRSWTYEDKLFGHSLINIPDPIITDIAKDLSISENVIYSTVGSRLRQLAIERSKHPDITKTHKFVDGLLMRLRQMTGHVLLIDPTIFRYLKDEDIDAIEDSISEGTEHNPDPHANDYLEAVRELQKSITCVVCGQRAIDLRWATCNHAYCYRCLEDQMHLAAEKGLDAPPCKICKCRMSQLTDEAEHEKSQQPRWLNKSGKVIPSAKSAKVVKLLRAWKDPITGDPDAKAVVFTTFKDAHKFLADTFKEEEWKFTVLTSEMSLADRNASVSRFTNDPDTSIMLATSGVGGIGLNLMAAKYLINYDHYFNESTELQARGRIYRIGQHEETTMVSLTALGTVDEHIRRIKRRKTKNIARVMASSKKKTLKALLKMFEKVREEDDIMGSDWEDDVELGDEVF